MKTGVSVRDAMTLNVISVTPDFSISECAKVMQANKIGALLVTEDDVTLGILTERDIVRKGVISGKSMKSMLAHDVMEKNVISINPDADLYEAIGLMNDHDIRHLPVMEKKKIAGFLTIKDILKIEPQLFDLVAERYVLREENRKPTKRQAIDTASDEVEALING